MIYKYTQYTIFRQLNPKLQILKQEKALLYNFKAAVKKNNMHANADENQLVVNEIVHNN